MKNLTFIGDIDQYSVDHIDEIHFKYHINTFDFPMLHSHKDYWEFTILTDGKIHNILNEKKETYPQNTLFFACTTDAHCLKKATSEKIRYINIAVKESYLSQLLNLLSPTFMQKLMEGERAFPIPTETIYKIEELLYKANLLKSAQLRTKNDLLNSAFLLIIQHIFSSKINVLDDKLSDKHIWTQKLSKIMQTPDFPSYTVQDLCKKMGYSRMQLNRLFKKYLDKTPHEYLADYRLRYARNLLRTTDMKILDVAMALGYSTLSQFQLSFKKRFGLPPGQYRKKSKNPTSV